MILSGCWLTPFAFARSIGLRRAILARATDRHRRRRGTLLQQGRRSCCILDAVSTTHKTYSKSHLLWLQLHCARPPMRAGSNALLFPSQYVFVFVYRRRDRAIVIWGRAASVAAAASFVATNPSPSPAGRSAGRAPAVSARDSASDKFSSSSSIDRSRSLSVGSTDGTLFTTKGQVKCPHYTATLESLPLFESDRRNRRSSNGKVDYFRRVFADFVAPK